MALGKNTFWPKFGPVSSIFIGAKGKFCDNIVIF